MKIFTFDTTLRDGTQGESVSFSVDDKLLIAQKLDELGIDYIEGGWPGSNPKDKDFFARAQTELQPEARQAHRLRRHALRPPHGRRGPQRAIAGRGRHARGLHLRQELGPAYRARARHHRRRKPEADQRNRRLSQARTARKWCTTPSTSSTATLRNPDFALRTLEAAQNAGAERALPLRYQRRHAHRPPGRDLRRSAQALRRHPRHPHAQRFRRGRGQHAGRRRSRRHARAGLHQRIRRALRQRQSLFHHRQSGAEAGSHRHRPGQAHQPVERGALRRRTGQSAAAQQSTLCRPQCFCAQRRRPRLRRLEGIHHLRARHARKPWAIASAS